jgi:hypothetical protein
VAFETEIGTLDFARCEAHAKGLTDAALQFSMRDARDAAREADREARAGYISGADYPQSAGRRAGKYWDECYTYAAEMKRRRTRFFDEELGLEF